MLCFVMLCINVMFCNVMLYNATLCIIMCCYVVSCHDMIFYVTVCYVVYVMLSYVVLCCVMYLCCANIKHDYTFDSLTSPFGSTSPAHLSLVRKLRKIISMFLCFLLIASWMAFGSQLGSILGGFGDPSWSQVGTKSLQK